MKLILSSVKHKRESLSFRRRLNMANSPFEPANGKDRVAYPPRYKKPANRSPWATVKTITTVPPVTTTVTGTIPGAPGKSATTMAVN